MRTTAATRAEAAPTSFALPWIRLARTGALLLVATALTLVVCASDVAAQDSEGAGGEGEARAGASGDSVQLVFEREVFSYPSHARRNPFRPLTGSGDAGPRFEELVLLGAIVSAEASESVALLGVRGASGPGAATHRLRAGQMVGNTRIVEVRPREVVVDVEEFGLRERRVLQLRRTAPVAEGAGVDPDTITSSADSASTDAGEPDEGAGSTGSDTDGDVGTNGNGGTR